MSTYTPPAACGHDWDWARIRALCLREARRVLGATTTADDAAQEAAIRAWRRRANCRTPAAPDPWIAAIARREALRILAQRRDQPLADPAEEPAEDQNPDLDIEDALDVRRALRTMDGQDRRLIVGHYWQDLPNSELAEQLGVAEVTVRVRLHRLRRQLHKTLVEA
ncbi:MAG TPA: sigma-70 family RNA polymerase sigma factor [Solirubrobacteraceae bacterium]|nr:sigma-70 family RNA polymerase sigma factor [Solirubrobacteraceae bacterium]